MKYFSKLTLLIVGSLFLAFGGCHKYHNDDNTNTSNAITDTGRCFNSVLPVIITPSDLQTVANTPNFKKVYIQFKTENDHDFYASAYTGIYPYNNVSNYFHPLHPSSPFRPNKPYILGNLEWKFSPSLPDMSLQYYCLLPAMDNDNIHVTYTYIEIPTHFQFKDSSYNVDSSFIVNANNEQIDSLAAYAVTKNGSINPIPPKQPL
jgi:hypothetical protein